MEKHGLRVKRVNTNLMVKVALLGVLSFLLMLLEFPIPIFPAFLQMDFGDVPALLGSFALGPIAGVWIEFIKGMLFLITGNSTTAGVGELSNFVIGSTFVFVAGYIYNKGKTMKNALIACISGTISMTVLGVFSNYFVMIPFYSKAYGMPIDAIVNMGSVITPLIKDVMSLVIYAIVPFNIFKGTLISIVVMIVYKKVSPILNRG